MEVTTMGDVIKRTLSTGRIAYYARTTLPDGRRISTATKQPTEEKALEWLHAWEARLRAGDVGLVKPTREEREAARALAKRQDMTVRELSEKFLSEYAAPRLKDVKAYRAKARSIFASRVWPWIGERRAAKLTQADVETLRDALLSKYKPRTVILALAQLSKVYSWAQRRNVIALAGNPVSKIERPSPGPSSLEYLSKLEVSALLKAAEGHPLHGMVATAIFGGLRRGELSGLRWQDVHLDAGRIDVVRSYESAPKSGKARHVPINPSLLPILRALEKTKTHALVFPHNGGMASPYDTLGLPELMKQAGVSVPAHPWHALRHTFASHFMMAGGNILTLQKLLGHSTLTVTMIYAHLSPDHMHAEVARMQFPTGGDVVDLAAERARREGNNGDAGAPGRDSAAGAVG